MYDVQLIDNTLRYVSNEKQTIILNFNNFFANKSCLSLQATDRSYSLPFILYDLKTQYENLSLNEENLKDTTDYFLIDALLSAYLITTSQPVKIAEIGCTNGRLSFHLSTIIGKFNEQSTLCCISNTIGNESGNQWLDMISQAEVSPNLSFMATDYHDTNLNSEHFNIVVINNSVVLNNTDAIVSEAVRILKPNGFLICYAKQDLVRSIKDVASSYEEYPVSSDTSVLVVRKKDVTIKPDELYLWKTQAEKDCLLAEIVLQEDINTDRLFAYIQTLDSHATIAAKNGFVDIKVNCLLKKEKLLKKYVDIKNQKLV